MTGLSVLLQSNALRQALALPIARRSAYGKLLDADSIAWVPRRSASEMEELMHSKAARRGRAALPLCPVR